MRFQIFNGVNPWTFKTPPSEAKGAVMTDKDDADWALSVPNGVKTVYFPSTIRSKNLAFFLCIIYIMAACIKSVDVGNYTGSLNTFKAKDKSTDQCGGSTTTNLLYTAKKGSGCKTKKNDDGYKIIISPVTDTNYKQSCKQYTIKNTSYSDVKSVKEHTLQNGDVITTVEPYYTDNGCNDKNKKKINRLLNAKKCQSAYSAMSVHCRHSYFKKYTTFISDADIKESTLEHCRTRPKEDDIFFTPKPTT